MNPRFVDPETLHAADAFVRGLARSLLFDADRAEDVAQEAWLAALRTRHEARAGMRAWLTGAVKHLAGKSIRTEGRRAAHEAHAAASTGGGVPSAHEILAREAMRRELVDAVLALPEPYRSPLLLRYFEELPPRVIARRLDLPVETVRTQVKRGLAILRERLDDRHQHRASWAFLLVPYVGHASMKSALIGATLKGMISMSTQAKVVAAAALILAAGGFMMWKQASDAAFDAARARTLAVEAEALQIERAEAAARIRAQKAADAAPALVPSPFRESESAPAVPSAQEPASLRISVVWEKSGAAAAGVPLQITALIQPNPLIRVTNVVTAADGTCLMERIPAAAYRIRCGLGGEATSRVIPGKRSEMRLAIPHGTTVKGLVVDAGERPVSGAAVWVWPDLSGGEGSPVATTASDGTFELNSLKMTGWTRIGARARGFAPSFAVIMTEAAGAVCNVKLRFHAAGGEISGAVSDANGKPVVGATVAVGDPWGAQIKLPDGGVGARPPAIVVTTDDRGIYRIEGAAVEKLPVVVRGAGFGPWRGEVDVSANVTTRLDVTLGRGVTVKGVVRDDAGAPIAGAKISVGNSDTLGGALAWSADDGSYRVDDVNAGVFAISAGRDGQGYVSTSFTADVGGEIVWDPVLSRGKVFGVRVVDERGAPLSGFGVFFKGTEASGSESRQEYTGDDGRVTIINCRSARYDIEVTDVNARSCLVASRKDVAIDIGEVELSVPDAARPTSYIVGTVLKPDGTPAGGVTVLEGRTSEHSRIIHKADPEAGTFRLGPRAAGSYVIEIESPDFEKLTLPPHTLGKGETWDLGQLQLKPKKK